MKKKRIPQLALSAILSVVGCAREINFRQYEQDSPFVVGVDGWGSNSLKSVGERMGEDMRLPVKISRVHYWRNVLNDVERAYDEGRKIFLIGYSAGCHQIKKVSDNLAQKRISVDTVIFLDPTYTSSSEIGIENAKKIVSFFSSAERDLMGFARGDPTKFMKDSCENCEPPVFIQGKHLDFIFSRDLREKLASHLSDSREYFVYAEKKE